MISKQSSTFPNSQIAINSKQAESKDVSNQSQTTTDSYKRFLNKNREIIMYITINHLLIIYVFEYILFPTNNKFMPSISIGKRYSGI